MKQAHTQDIRGQHSTRTGPSTVNDPRERASGAAVPEDQPAPRLQGFGKAQPGEKVAPRASLCDFPATSPPQGAIVGGRSDYSIKSESLAWEIHLRSAAGRSPPASWTGRGVPCWPFTHLNPQPQLVFSWVTGERAQFQVICDSSNVRWPANLGRGWPPGGVTDSSFQTTRRPRSEQLGQYSEQWRHRASLRASRLLHFC